MRRLLVALMISSGFTSSSFATVPFTDEEKLSTTILAAGALYTMFLSGGVEEEPRWIHPLPGDLEMTGLLGADTASGANSAKTWSDWGLATITVTPLVFPGKAGGEGRWQAVQSYSVTALVTQAVKTWSARERPYVSQCRNNKIGQDCFSAYRNGSFFSGHASFAFTGAGLLCASRADAGCSIGLAVATGISLLRIASRQHYLSDVLVGGLAGWASGYYLSKWRTPDREREGASDGAAGIQLQFPIP